MRPATENPVQLWQLSKRLQAEQAAQRIGISLERYREVQPGDARGHFVKPGEGRGSNIPVTILAGLGAFALLRRLATRELHHVMAACRRRDAPR